MVGLVTKNLNRCTLNGSVNKFLSLRNLVRSGGLSHKHPVLEPSDTKFVQSVTKNVNDFKLKLISFL